MVYLLARIYAHLPKDADLKRLQSLNDNKFQWRRTLYKCGIDGNTLRSIIRKVKESYKWLMHRRPDGTFEPFTLKETISLIIYLMRNFEREHWDIIMALYDTDWNFDEIYEKHSKTKRAIYYFLNKYIKKPMRKYLSRLR